MIVSFVLRSEATALRPNVFAGDLFRFATEDQSGCAR